MYIAYSPKWCELLPFSHTWQLCLKTNTPSHTHQPLGTEIPSYVITLCTANLDRLQYTQKKGLGSSFQVGVMSKITD